MFLTIWKFFFGGDAADPEPAATMHQPLIKTPIQEYDLLDHLYTGKSRPTAPLLTHRAEYIRSHEKEFGPKAIASLLSQGLVTIDPHLICALTPKGLRLAGLRWRNRHPELRKNRKVKRLQPHRGWYIKKPASGNNPNIVLSASAKGSINERGFAR